MLSEYGLHLMHCFHLANHLKNRIFVSQIYSFEIRFKNIIPPVFSIPTPSTATFSANCNFSSHSTDFNLALSISSSVDFSVEWQPLQTIWHKSNLSYNGKWMYMYFFVTLFNCKNYSITLMPIYWVYSSPETVNFLSLTSKKQLLSSIFFIHIRHNFNTSSIFSILFIN